MKICRITCSYSPHQFGGADIFAGNITEELSNRGYPHVIITINPSKGDTFERKGNINIYRFHPLNVSTVHRIGKAGLIKQGIWTVLDIYSYYSYLKIKSILNKEKPDVVHIHTPVDTTLAAFNAASNLRLPVVFTVHDYLLLCRRVILVHGDGKICTNMNINPLCRIYRGLTRKLVEKKVDIVTGPSEFVLKVYKDSGFFKNCQTVVFPHGVKLNNDSEIAKEKNADNKSTDFNILYVGGLTKHKGVHVLINAFRNIKNMNIKLHIVGYGVYEKRLKYLAENDNRIIFYGKIPYYEIKNFYKMADILVVPSIWYEVFGRIILEAFSMGIPVVSSDIGGMRELVINNYNGFLFEPGNIDQLKRILCSVIENPEKLKSLGINAYESVKKYEISSSINKLVEIYEEAIKINQSKH